MLTFVARYELAARPKGESNDHTAQFALQDLPGLQHVRTPSVRVQSGQRALLVRRKRRGDSAMTTPKHEIEAFTRHNERMTRGIEELRASLLKGLKARIDAHRSWIDASTKRDMATFVEAQIAEACRLGKIPSGTRFDGFEWHAGELHVSITFPHNTLLPVDLKGKHA